MCLFLIACIKFCKDFVCSLSDFTHTHLIWSFFCSETNRLPDIGLWRQEAVQASGSSLGSTGGDAPGSNRGKPSVPVEIQGGKMVGEERRGDVGTDLSVK